MNKGLVVHSGDLVSDKQSSTRTDKRTTKPFITRPPPDNKIILTDKQVNATGIKKPALSGQ